jgi:hypothetical protein
MRRASPLEARAMRLRSEKGEGRLSSLIWLLVLVGFGWATWHVGPVYFAGYSLVDKMNEMARAPKYNHPDDKILDKLMVEVRERRLDPYITRSSFKVNTYENSRRISVEYDVPIDVLPGYKRTFHFKHDVDQPII